jgi:hypothetical protein
MALPQLKGGAWAAAQNQEAQLGGITRRHNHKTKNGAEERQQLNPISGCKKTVLN